MAKTSKTMASRKRPPPAANGGRVAVPAPAGRNRNPLPLPAGIDALLAKYARHLPPGGTVTVRLVKGPSSSSVDPVAARRAAAKAAREEAAAAGNDDGDGHVPGGGGTGGMTDPLPFPRVAKFVESVATPDFFAKGGLGDGRFYEEEVPKAKDESDEEESTAYKPSNLENGGDDPNCLPGDVVKKKKRRWRRNDPRPRRWVLQEKAEFFERIRKRRQSGTAADEEEDGQPLSHQYHGVAESNASKYVYFTVAPPCDPAAAAPSSPSCRAAEEQISVMPIHGFHTFAQPYKFASLSMEEAEIAIEQRRDVVTRYMMHGKLSASSAASSEAKAALASGVAGGGGGRAIGAAPKAMSRARLLGRLAGGGGAAGDGDDDVMGDVRFSSSTSGGGRVSGARRELLSSLGDGDTAADGDGVLGGANDAEFGGRRRFARVTAKKEADGDGGAKKGGGKGGGAATSTGFEAGAMEEGFYQRDIAAEYEALDYDAAEQADDDDVNVGEDEMMDDGGGYGGGDYESGDDDGQDSEEEEGEDDDGLGGMATSGGLRAMLARARGGSGPSAADAAAAASSPNSGEGIDRMLDAAKKTAEEMDKKKQSSTAEPLRKRESSSSSPPSGPAAVAAAKGVEKDKDGKRLITLDAVRREIWLNNGAITSKRLMKKFDVTRKCPDRQALFKQIVLELCTMQKDADGNKLVLKQHYSKI